jgi:hypothetical protein
MSALSLQRWTFVGVQAFPGCMVMLLANVPCADGWTTVSMVAYDAANPVRITELP